MVKLTKSLKRMLYILTSVVLIISLTWGHKDGDEPMQNGD
jgi:hypothetical protein